ncbi:UDP-glucose/GDP-mannose dehydrogenase family protein [Candidatus Berkelbacteria bacterium]|nr:UDP-glucose/GDP-mannose dehydrogenase family protein [Candidatus Berkelbacteria bacterium]
MKIAIIGTGYVGLVTGTGFAELGHDITCVDIDHAKVAKLKRGVSPIYEPGLQELIERNIAEGRLKFTTKHAEAVKEAAIIFNAVDTPSAPDGSVSMKSLYAATDDIAQALAKLPKNHQFYRVIVNKSTVPIGTADEVANRIRSHYRGEFDVVSNPEFLREGQAVHDFFHPDRVVIGNGSGRARELMTQLYKTFKSPILFVDTKTAEMIKYASNSFLATSISFINSLTELCEKLGADITMVSEGMKLDKRIGKQAFLTAGAGYGGSCFSKDVKGLISIGKTYKVELPILKATDRINAKQRRLIFNKIKKLLPRLRGRTIAVWGLAFKPGTDDLRDAPAIDVINWLRQAGAKISAFDPVAETNAKKLLPQIQFSPNPFHAVQGADLLLVMTEWSEFRAIDRAKIKAAMRHANVVDGRNIFDRTELESLGFRYEAIGR